MDLQQEEADSAPSSQDLEVRNSKKCGQRWGVRSGTSDFGVLRGVSPSPPPTTMLTLGLCLCTYTSQTCRLVSIQKVLLDLALLFITPVNASEFLIDCGNLLPPGPALLAYLKVQSCFENLHGGIPLGSSRRV